VRGLLVWRERQHGWVTARLSHMMEGAPLEPGHICYRPFLRKAHHIKIWDQWTVAEERINYYPNEYAKTLCPEATYVRRKA